MVELSSSCKLWPWVPFNRWSWELIGTLLEIVQVVAPKDLALHRFDPKLAPINARAYTYRRPWPYPPILKGAFLSATVKAGNSAIGDNLKSICPLFIILTAS